ncbi:hypothetical protein H4696_005907 [Amycolatopsis lexingtonensis]|uniref:AbiEi antitoxin C-terminal domain-containing protein n=1 Tax=Amycolatopsis lexingtonensis TaxID=218822 RepID=A0ABR9I6K2_9PSEU|nr:hypothetical protein [Amycolatopsis lexingtonensis]
MILLHKATPTRRELLIAALVYAGPNAMVTGLAACHEYGLRVPAGLLDDVVHVLVPDGRKLLSSEYVTIERTWRLPTPYVRNGIPLSPPVRAVTDALRRLRTEEPVNELLVEAVQHGRCSLEALTRELDTGTKRGTALPRRILADWVDLRSVAETRAKRLSERLSPPPTHWNREIRDAAGSYVGRPDAWWDDVALAWEIDSFDFHFSRDDYARTLRRNSRYAAAGITVVPTLPSRLTNDPEGVLHDIEAAYRAASNRPRPPVFLA